MADLPRLVSVDVIYPEIGRMPLILRHERDLAGCIVGVNVGRGIDFAVRQGIGVDLPGRCVDAKNASLVAVALQAESP